MCVCVSVSVNKAQTRTASELEKDKTPKSTIREVVQRLEDHKSVSVYCRIEVRTCVLFVWCLIINNYVCYV